ncbi:hypothetical protein HHK36_014314 [Tetracentron sinense]|uniref:RRM domain-containing protein n=1 Tax=Tetracentron sinense TaxID=13715 RepID=A0A835DFA5_TETSI|nr:hypothetical protein HHK36_014314 [Tetracentron sinense]
MDVAEEKQNEVDFVTLNGEEEVEEEIEEHQSSEHGINDVDSSGNELKHSVDRDSSSGKIFIGGVSWETSEENFTKHFEKYGEITDSVIMKDKHTRRPRGFGFVTFANPDAVDEVLKDDHVIDGRTVEVKRTVPREDMQVKVGSKTKKIFVGGIPTSFTEDELKEYFSSYGNIVEHQLMLDHSTGRSRGFGFVTFESEDTVEEIISEGRTHELGGKQVEIKKAEPRRAGGDQGSDVRPRYGGGAAKSYGGFGSGAVGYGGAYGGGYRAGGGYGGGYRAGGGYAERMAGAYGGYEAYGGGPAGFYGGYGGYGYGVGYGAGLGGPMYGGAGYGGDGYGSQGGYGGAYNGADGYGGNRGYKSSNANRKYHPYGK